MWKYCLFLLFPILILGIFIVPSQIFASWVVDLNPPIVTMQAPVTGRDCYTTNGWTSTNFTFHATDNLSGIVWIKAQVTPPGNTTTQTLTPTFPTSYDWITTLPSVGMSDNSYYNLVLTALDGAGNSSSPYNAIINFRYQTSAPCGVPWIQTIGGDVHSNNQINIPAPQ